MVHTIEDLYKMKLHETNNVDANTTVMRVPGGFIYTVEHDGWGDRFAISSTFVPDPLVPNLESTGPK